MNARCTMVLVLALWVTAPTDASGLTAMDTVEELHARFIGVMKRADSLGFEGRIELLAPAVGGAFDLKFMAIKSLGLGARDLDAVERQRWVAAFTQLMVSNYARRFRSYSGQRFESLGEEPVSLEQVVVRSRLVRADKEDVRLDYRLRQTPEGWRIIDIYAQGTTSLLSLRRAEVSSFLDREGFEKLVTEVEAKATRR